MQLFLKNDRNINTVQGFSLSENLNGVQFFRIHLFLGTTGGHRLLPLPSITSPKATPVDMFSYLIGGKIL